MVVLFIPFNLKILELCCILQIAQAFYAAFVTGGQKPVCYMPSRGDGVSSRMVQFVKFSCFELNAK